jgi:hypothetical protein
MSIVESAESAENRRMTAKGKRTTRRPRGRLGSSMEGEIRGRLNGPQTLSASGVAHAAGGNGGIGGSPSVGEGAGARGAPAQPVEVDAENVGDPLEQLQRRHALAALDAGEVRAEAPICFASSRCESEPRARRSRCPTRTALSTCLSPCHATSADRSAAASAGLRRELGMRKASCSAGSPSQ